ncbi:MAG: radical SAM protein [Firmicutes bacterium]|nr:radical SAM protein [Bacillota bacterium]
MKLLADLNIEEMEALLAGTPKYRARQLFKWVSLGATYGEMSDIPLKIRQKLKSGGESRTSLANGSNNEFATSEGFGDAAAEIIKEVAAKDGSVKLLYKLWDSNAVEGIYMPHAYGNTLCVSTQVGCRMKCAFCASGIGGLVRNLSAGEIYGQVIAANKRFSHEANGGVGRTNERGDGDKGGTGGDLNKTNKNDARAISKVVFMGSGEPLDNYDATTKAIKLLCDTNGLNLSQRGISLSTCGLPDKIRRLADEGFSVTLSISLHATTDEARRGIMPVAKSFALHEVLEAAKYYFEKTSRRVIIEYICIKDANVSFFDAKRLKDLLRGMSAHVNLIPLNYVKESALAPASSQQAGRFLKWLKDLGVSATLRKSSGAEASGACGQLRNKFVCHKDRQNT